jgi:hypothetical protein
LSRIIPKVDGSAKRKEIRELLTDVGIDPDQASTDGLINPKVRQLEVKLATSSR